MAYNCIGLPTVYNDSEYYILLVDSVIASTVQFTIVLFEPKLN